MNNFLFVCNFISHWELYQSSAWTHNPGSQGLQPRMSVSPSVSPWRWSTATNLLHQSSGHQHISFLDTLNGFISVYLKISVTDFYVFSIHFYYNNVVEQMWAALKHCLSYLSNKICIIQLFNYYKLHKTRSRVTLRLMKCHFLPSTKKCLYWTSVISKIIIFLEIFS